jgi:hypothetical protein
MSDVADETGDADENEISLDSFSSLPLGSCNVLKQRVFASVSTMPPPVDYYDTYAKNTSNNSRNSRRHRASRLARRVVRIARVAERQAGTLQLPPAPSTFNMAPPPPAYSPAGY